MIPIPLLLCLACLSLLACNSLGRSATRPLNRGSIVVPKRLEPMAVETGLGSALFRFTNYSGSFFYMGPHAVVKEKLAVLSWMAASDPRDSEAAQAVQDHISPHGIQWRRDGEFELGEAIQEVNTHRFPAWILVRQVPAHNLTVAYMVWKKDASLQKAKALVNGVIASFQPNDAGAPDRSPGPGKTKRQ